ncbi:hypothetical protein COO60DRAFT_1504472, partial [Scenedesmus sp. NREL 46B-D3]
CCAMCPQTCNAQCCRALLCMHAALCLITVHQAADQRWSVFNSKSPCLALVLLPEKKGNILVAALMSDQSPANKRF